MPYSTEDMAAYLRRHFGKPTIEQLEAILEQEEFNPIEILPNGEIRSLGSGTVKKPLTLRENLGGEYAHAC